MTDSKPKVTASNKNVVFFCPACEQLHAIAVNGDFNGDVNNPTFSNSLYGHYGSSGVGCHVCMFDGVLYYVASSNLKFQSLAAGFKSVEMLPVSDWFKRKIKLEPVAVNAEWVHKRLNSLRRLQ